MKKNRSAIRIPMPLRYVINLILIVAVWFVLNSLIQSGVITNYWSGILITVGINIILATSLNVATGYLGQLPLGHAGFMAVGAYAGGIFMKAMREDSSSVAQTVMAANAPMLLQRSMVDGNPAEGVMSAGQVAALIGRLDSCEEVIGGIVRQAMDRRNALNALTPA